MATTQKRQASASSVTRQKAKVKTTLKEKPSLKKHTLKKTLAASNLSSKIIVEKSPKKLLKKPQLIQIKIEDAISSSIKVSKVFKSSFKVGDKVVYPAHGVGEIQDEEVKVVSGSEHRFFIIKIIEKGMTIRTPVNQVDSVGLRKIVDKKTVEEVYQILRDKNVTIDTQTWNRRYREYTQKIKTGSVYEIAKVIRDLSVLQFDKDLSFGERKMLDSARALLVKELSIAKSSSEDLVLQEIQDIFQQVS